LTVVKGLGVLSSPERNPKATTRMGVLVRVDPVRTVVFDRAEMSRVAACSPSVSQHVCVGVHRSLLDSPSEAPDVPQRSGFRRPTGDQGGESSPGGPPGKRFGGFANRRGPNIGSPIK
jgi:hypothetical protein